ncbi:putative retrotransposon hot spot (RHS) protein [Trypanosoma rangeli]|uniref:Putative retrotransposon hot spot (RHS) protein n=1 Tax=Trypanosoma rangeli TaxID=5698 RepID=A0A422MRC6_TRYRA|nr:putative retrotransposon hot spot (RHS) protein [Trypanosoma rangeli]RNE95782.1 putative retrotransposon hot spot (RHS) protein [Trypanosoma rangeli]|eukprot:RNE95782.1 putative retrotransposon hot spot (RHS) protein [Trypanosoma rangeli]
MSRHRGAPAQRRRVEGAPQRPRWTLAGSMEDVRSVRGGQINIILLNDFLRQYVGPDRAVAEDQNVVMEVFVRGPDRYVTEQRRREGKFSIPPGYQLFEDARKLTERMVGTLRDWKEFTDKSIVSAITRTKLKAALQLA